MHNRIESKYHAIIGVSHISLKQLEDLIQTPLRALTMAFAFEPSRLRDDSPLPV
ncbi:hypothetical protein AGR1C_pTi0160 [Agrobacterium fabacearum TT111]|nr:hypothetical protein AGR1C_pTi0160 [Agrobacterium fabacearum TT111]